MTATLISPDPTGDVVELRVEPANGKKFTLAELQGHVGGFVERVILPHGQTMWVNEEGLLHGMPRNPRASELAGGYIVGPVLVMDGRRQS